MAGWTSAGRCPGAGGGRWSKPGSGKPAGTPSDPNQATDGLVPKMKIDRKGGRPAFTPTALHSGRLERPGTRPRNISGHLERPGMTTKEKFSQNQHSTSLFSSHNSLSRREFERRTYQGIANARTKEGATLLLLLISLAMHRIKGIGE